MSRISPEKNLEAFLDLELPGTKFVVGEGPYKSFLSKKYHGKAVFLPYKNARYYLSESDVFVIPSRFDTFNLTMLEALACGLPVAAYPVLGPIDVIKQGITGFLSENLHEAALSCLSLKKADAIDLAKQYTWEKTAEAFTKHQLLIN
jgi:glycosyltransferase involved in cell wall biosynthesis